MVSEQIENTIYAFVRNVALLIHGMVPLFIILLCINARILPSWTVLLGVFCLLADLTRAIRFELERASVKKINIKAHLEMRKKQ